MNSHQQLDSITLINQRKYITRNQLTSLLKQYNCYYEDQKNMQLTFDQTQDRQLVVSGLLEILWGVKRPIRFRIQDEKLNCTSPIELPEPLGSSRSKSGMIRWGEFDDLYRISEIEETSGNSDIEINLDKEFSCYDTLRPKASENPDSPSLYRTMSDAALVTKRVKSPAAERRDLQHHRFSINGHFYNYKTSIFTPAFGSQTKVCVNSLMKTGEVIEQLLHKFKIENSPHEFALYIIHASGEKKRIRDTDSPMWERLLQGPSVQVARMFLMDRDAEEVTSDVAQYIKFNVPVLKSFLTKLNEEEDREIQRTIDKYKTEKAKLLQQLHSRNVERTETTV
ncbi:ras association domain-containing protein 6 [Ambystoma mexicanum]|uniref:ras association domain-containing protein 6 n=1 Tax=Ambystoma mexicanum TaxID=8296 RepID=UPI0037E86BDA